MAKLYTKNQIDPVVIIGQIAGVTGHFWEIGKFRILHLFFLSSMYEINAMENIFKEKTISKKCLACTSFNYMHLFLEHFENITFSCFGYKKIIYHPTDLEIV